MMAYKLLLSTMALALVTIMLSATVDGLNADGNCEKADVEDHKHVCTNCMQRAICKVQGEPSTEGFPLCVNQACTIVSGVALCVPIGNSNCTCSAATQCDFYDSGAVLYCGNTNPIYVEVCEDGEICLVDTVSCGTGTTVQPQESTPSPGELCTNANPDDLPGYVIVPPACTSGLLCIDNSNPTDGYYECSDGQYFDVEENKCFSSPPVPCVGYCTNGACADKTNCSMFYVCNNGEEIVKETCEPGTYFDPETGMCDLNTADPACAAYEECDFASGGGTGNTSSSGTTSGGGTVTTTSSGTTSGGGTVVTPSDPCDKDNVGESYEYPGDDTMYWMCVNKGNGVYGYIPYHCPDGSVYNPEYAVCLHE